MTDLLVNKANLQNSYLVDEEDEFHTCPNADVQACEFCKILNTLSILNRSFKLRNMSEMCQIIMDIFGFVSGLRSNCDRLRPILSQFDFEDIKANGYRTVIIVVECAVSKCYFLSQEIYEKSKVFTPASHPTLYEKLVDWKRIFRILLIILECLNNFVQDSKNGGCLFTSNQAALEKLISMNKERVNVLGFHGRLLGFQFCKSVRNPLRLVSTMMATFSEIYKSNNLFTSSILSSKSFINYWRNPSLRADRIAKICEEDPLTFFKEFWLIQERGLGRILSNCMGESVETNLVISIPPTKMTVKTRSGKNITILPPSEYTGIKPINCRLISQKMRPGSVCSGGLRENNEKLSRSLIFHAHGGGFVAQSSNSHLVYLKSWARGAPILSVDYSLAPSDPYPRALHEAFYAYLWALENAHLLGSTAERIVFAGDSAGGLLLTGVTILCIELGVRIPDAILLVYTPQLLESAVSPSRILSLSDPLIPYPALAACLGAYVGKNFDPSLAHLPGSIVEGQWEPEEQNSEKICRKFTTITLEELEGVNLPVDDYHLSPLIANDEILKQFPKTAIITTVFDPCQDDCIEFAKRLKEAKVQVTLDVLPSLPHGFLNFGKISEDCYKGIEICFRRLKEFIF